MDCIGPVMDATSRLWVCSSKHLAYIHNLQENLQKLQTEKNALCRRRHDIKLRVEAAEQQPGMGGRTKEVEAWLASAETMEKEVIGIINEGYQELQNKCVGSCCPKNLKSTYKIGKRISKKINSVTDLLHKGEPFYSDCGEAATFAASDAHA